MKLAKVEKYILLVMRSRQSPVYGVEITDILNEKMPANWGFYKTQSIGKTLSRMLKKKLIYQAKANNFLNKKYYMPTKLATKSLQEEEEYYKRLLDN